jgi:repressor LexA
MTDRGPGGLTRRQQQVLDFVTDSTARTGVPPTVREIGEALGLASTNAVAGHLKALIRAGALGKLPRKSRGLRVGMENRDSPHFRTNRENRDSPHFRTKMGAVPIFPVFPGTIPIVGRIAAGLPILAAENLEGTLVADPFLVRDPAETFALRVEGDSMTGDGILPGDYILVRRQPVAERGAIVVALIDDEATVKRYAPDGDRVRLLASNPAYAPIEVAAGDGRRLQILGVVTGVFRRL